MDIPGYMGKILFVDLGTGATEVKPLKEAWAKDYLGGWGINYRLAYDLIKPNVDPFSPENPIILGEGPFVGTLYPGASKMMATTKMPMTASKDGKHAIATSTSGSHRFTLMFKYTGYDHMVIQGRSEKPVYLKIDDDAVELIDAGDLWGQKDVYETAEILLDRHEGFGVISIGKAGENRVRYAMAYVDKSWHLGKSGFGAIMGAKNLKAIVVRGSKGVKIADPDRFMAVVNPLLALARNNPAAAEIRKVGFHSSWDLIWVHNYYQSEKWKKAEWTKYYGIETVPNVLKDHKACCACPMGCKTDFLVKSGPYAGQEASATHYLTAAVAGSRLEIEDPGAAIKFMDKTNLYGMCAFNALSMVDWITRCFQDGVITKEQTEGVNLSRDVDTYLLLLDWVADRKGALGNAMADGWFALSEFVGKDATKDYIQAHAIAKGQESIYPPRAAKLDPMRITMIMTNPRGGQSPQGHSATTAPLRPVKAVKRDAVNTGMSEEDLGKTFSEDNFDHARLTRHIEDAYGVYNALGVCSVYATFGWTNIKVLAEAYSALTGIETSPEELKKKGERIMNLYKILNVREGFTRKEDSPPEAIFTPIQTPEGEQRLEDYYRKKAYTKEDCERLLDTYYEDRGWDVKTGIPTREKLKDLGLEEFAEAIPTEEKG
ncbi:MAG: aldehyde ferredoxin oxidoreductase C-terminal domain-containing protein [Pseudomonadota bacterium]